MNEIASDGTAQEVEMDQSAEGSTDLNSFRIAKLDNGKHGFSFADHGESNRRWPDSNQQITVYQSMVDFS